MKKIIIPTLILFLILCTIVFSQNSSTEFLSITKEFELGTHDADDNYFFSRFIDLIIDRNDNFYVYDRNLKNIRKYDKNGKYIRTLGSEGKGPGEYSMVLEMGIDSQNGLCLWEIHNSRIIVYDENGDFRENIHALSKFTTYKSFFVDQNNNYYIKIIDHTREPKIYNMTPSQYEIYSKEGAIIDTLIIPEEETANLGFVIYSSKGTFRNFETKTISTLAPDGSLIVGRNDEYKFEIRGEDNITVERDFDPVRLNDRESEEIENYAEDIFKKHFDIPVIKPAYKEIITDQDGRIWVQIYTEAHQRTDENKILVNDNGLKITWFEETIFDLFSNKGQYIGRLKLPQGSFFLDAKGSFVYCKRTDDGGIYYIEKYGIEGLE